MSTSDSFAAAPCPTAGATPHDDASCSTPGAPHGQAARAPAPPESQPGVQQHSTTVTSMQMELSVDLGTTNPASVLYGTWSDPMGSNHHHSSNRPPSAFFDGADGAHGSMGANASTFLQHRNSDGMVAPANVAFQELACVPMDAPSTASNPPIFSRLGSAVAADDSRAHQNALVAANPPPSPSEQPALFPDAAFLPQHSSLTPRLSRRQKKRHRRHARRLARLASPPPPSPPSSPPPSSPPPPPPPPGLALPIAA